MTKRKRLAAGIYAVGDQIEVELDEFVRALGGDPTDPVDVENAEKAIAGVCAAHGIPYQTLEDRP